MAAVIVVSLAQVAARLVSSPGSQGKKHHSLALVCDHTVGRWVDLVLTVYERGDD